MRLKFRFFKGKNEFGNQIDIGIENGLRIIVAVKGGQVDDGIALRYKIGKFTEIFEIVVFERDTAEFPGEKTKCIVKMSP